MQQRNIAIDYLKFFLAAFVVVHHVGQAYGPTGGFWYYQDLTTEKISWLGRFFFVNASFSMGLFFMLSGYFFELSYQKKSSIDWLKGKLLRLGMPVLLALLFLQPVQMYFHYQQYRATPPLTFWEYYTQIYLGIGGMPAGFQSAIGFPEVNFGHLWFVEHLLVYACLFWLLRRYLMSGTWSELSAGQLYVAQLVLVTASSVAIQYYYKRDTWVALLGFIQAEPAHLPQYALMLLSGMIAARRRLLEHIPLWLGQTALASGLLLAGWYYTGLPPVFKIHYYRLAIFESVLCIQLCWAWLFAFQYLSRYFTENQAKYAKLSYPMYLFHVPFVLMLQYAYDGLLVQWPLLKFVLVSVCSLLVVFGFCLALYQWKIVRKYF